MLPRRRREGAHRRFGSAACTDIPAIRGVGKETGRGSSNAQVQEECLPGVWPDLRAERRGRGLVPAALLHAGLRRRREGKAPGEPDPVNDDAVREPRVLEALAQVLGEASPQEIAAAENEEAEEAQEPGVMAIEVTADRALIARTRPGEEAGPKLSGEAPSIIDVVVGTVRSSSCWNRVVSGASGRGNRPSRGMRARSTA